MTIGEVARKSGLRASAIRYYERLGLLPQPLRESGQRRYDGEVLDRLAVVRFARHVGFTIAELKVLLDGLEARPPSERWRVMARNKIAQLDAFTAQGKNLRSKLRKTLLHKCPKLAERGRAL